MWKHGFVGALIGLVMLLGWLLNPGGLSVIAQASETSILETPTLETPMLETPTPSLQPEAQPGEGEQTPTSAPTITAEAATLAPTDTPQPELSEEPIHTPTPTEEVALQEADTTDQGDFFLLEVDWRAANGVSAAERCERARQQLEANSFSASCSPLTDDKISLQIAGAGSLQDVRRLLFAGLIPEFDTLGGKMRLEVHLPIQAGQRLDVILQSRPASGYSWQLFTGEGSDFEAAGPMDYRKKQGAFSVASQQIIPLVAYGDGRQTLILIYKRPFDSHDQSVVRLQINLSEAIREIDLSDPAGVELQGQEPSVSLSLRSMSLSGEGMETMDLPARFDWREQGVVPPIRDQGPCGGCWAFAAVGVMESAIQINTGESVELSEQYLISCNLAQKNAMCGNVKYSCAIGGCEDAHDYHASETGQYQDQPGAVFEESFPYEARDAACPGSLAHPYRITNWLFVGGTSSPSVEQIKQAIYTYGPVTTRVCALGGFGSYSGGVYMEDWDCYDHAVILVGWDDSSQSWILRNSWGPGWGLDGYMYIRWGVSNVGQYVTYVTFNPPPPAPTALQPQGEVNTARPEFRWSQVTAANSYTLRVVSQASGSTVFIKDVPESACAEDICSYIHSSSLADGSYAFNVRANSADGSSPYSPPILFSINTRIPPSSPQALQPQGDLYTRKPLFKWEKVPSATSYDLRLRAIPDGEIVYTAIVLSSSCATGICQHQPSSRLPDGQYEFEVRASNNYGSSPYSPALAFAIWTEIPPFSPVTISPAGTIYVPCPKFRWQTAILAKTYRLKVYAADSHALILSHTLKSSTCGKTSCAYLPEGAIKNGEYYFEVTALNEYGESAPSAPRFFTQANFTPPESPLTIGPDGTDIYRRPRFQWYAVGRAESYTLQVYRANGRVVHRLRLKPACFNGICSYRSIKALPEGLYYFVVRANNKYGSSAYSQPRYFEVLTSIPPQTPRLLSPAEINYTANPPISWERVPLARSYALIISDASSGEVVQELRKSQLFCGRKICTKYPRENLPNGDYLVQISSSNLFGASDWSAPFAFRIGARTPPETPLTISPSGVLSNNQPIFSWEETDRTNSFQLQVRDNRTGQTVLQASVPCSICKAGLCEFSSPAVLYDGDYSFAVSAVNCFGSSPWSAPRIFTISGFDAPFNGSRNGWVVHAGGRWWRGRDHLYSNGQAGAMSSASYPVTYTDLVFEARLQRKGCESCFNAINVRGDPTLDNSNDWLSAYQFAYNNYGYFVVWKGINGHWTVLQDWTYSPYIIQAGGWNTLRVAVQGEDLYFYINGRMVWQGADSSLSSGRVGLEFYRDIKSRGNQFRADWARLSLLDGTFQAGHLDPLQAAINRLNTDASAERRPTHEP